MPIRGIMDAMFGMSDQWVRPNLRLHTLTISFAVPKESSPYDLLNDLLQCIINIRNALYFRW